MPKKQKVDTRGSPICGIDITIRDVSKPPEYWSGVFAEYAKKFVFQLEKGEVKGKEHYQVRLRAHKKDRLAGHNIWMQKYCKNYNLTATVNKQFENGNFDYVMKEDTRVAGPWSDKDLPTQEMHDAIDKSFLLPWQQQVIDEIKLNPDSRVVNVLYSREGRIGGSVFKKYLRAHKLATCVPSFNKMEDIMNMMMCKDADRCYFIDVPRGGGKVESGFWNGIESMKDGYCYDKRHSFKDRSFKTPHVWIKTNELPPVEALSIDRWALWGIRGGRLDPFSYDPKDYWAMNKRQAEQWQYCNTYDIAREGKERRKLQTSICEALPPLIADLVIGYLFW